jgi:diaminopimelate epimerase
VRLPFYKYHGCGNDFIFIDALQDKNLHVEKPAELVKRICDRHTGMGADGLAFLLPLADGEHTFRWDFYNQDGSAADMCGNAARCAALHFYLNHEQNAQGKFLSNAGTIHYKVLSPDKIELRMRDAKWGPPSIDYTLVNTGVPHVVVKVLNLDDKAALYQIARQYRYPKDLDKKGANISFYQLQGEAIRSVTFECGIEDFTLACGTGATACGLVAMRETQKPEIQVLLPGGNVWVRENTDGIFLIGPAVWVGQGVYVENETGL